jgi:hypothetical protein
MKSRVMIEVGRRTTPIMMMMDIWIEFCLLVSIATGISKMIQPAIGMFRLKKMSRRS